MLSRKDYQEPPMPALAPPPERSAPPRDLEVRPKHVKAWVEALPLSQVTDTAKKLAVHLTALNRAKLDGEDRVQILESCRPVAAVLFDELDAVYAKATVPLGPR